MDDPKNAIPDSIDSLINSNSSPTPIQPGDLASQTSDLPAFLTIVPLEYDKELIKCQNKAKKTIHSLLKFYLDEEIIQKNEYIIAKAKVAEMTLSGLFFQIKAAEHTIMTLHKRIHSGDYSPRMFEVLANLQGVLLEMMKHQTMQMIANEESMKRLKHDLGNAPKQLTDSKSLGAPSRGTRNLMKDIQGEIEAEFPEDPFEEKKDPIE